MYRKCGYLPAIGASGVNGVSVSIVEILLPTSALVSNEQPEHAYAPGFLDPKSEPDLTYLPSTAPDVASGKQSGNNTTIDTDERQEKLNSDIVDPDEYPSGPRLAFIVVALMPSIFLVSLDLPIVATAIPKITSQFHGLHDVCWYSAAFFITIGALICGIAPNSTTLIVGRAIAGLGAVDIGSGTYTLIAFSARTNKRPMFTGILGTSYGIAAVVGPLIGGALADMVSWRWCFYINLPIETISAFIILLFFKVPSAAMPKSATLLKKLIRIVPVGVILVIALVIS